MRPTTTSACRAERLAAWLRALGLALGLATALAPGVAAAQPGPSRTAGEQPRTLRHGGRDRSYVLRVPRGLAPADAPVPVVLVLHGGGGNAANAEQMSGFTGLVERERIIVAYPNGTGRRGDRLLTWNAVHCCGQAMEQRVDDVGFLGALLDAVAAAYPVDPRRVYVTGMSNGAMMSHRAARELAPRIAAVAPVVGAVFGDEPLAGSAVSAVIFNGLGDASVPAEGGLGKGLGRRAWDGTPPRPNLAQGEYWARANGCATAPEREARGAVVHWRYRCPEGRAVELYQLSDQGHAWPGGGRGSRIGDAPSAALDATEVMWAFFKAHPRR